MNEQKGQQNIQGNGYNQNNFNNMPVVKSETTECIILSVLELLCCNQITGIIGIIFSALAGSALAAGNIADYQNKIKCAKITLIVGLVSGIIIWVLVIIFYIMMFGIALISY